MRTVTRHGRVAGTWQSNFALAEEDHENEKEDSCHNDSSENDSDGENETDTKNTDSDSDDEQVEHDDIFNKSTVNTQGKGGDQDGSFVITKFGRSARSWRNARKY